VAPPRLPLALLRRRDGRPRRPARGARGGRAVSAVGLYSATARAAEAHTGQHLQGCITCSAVVDAEARGLRVPAIGERVVMDVTLLGEVYAVEVIVAQVDVDPASRRLR